MLVTTPDMNADIVPMDNSVLASFSVLRPQCSGSRHTPGRLSGLPNPVCVGSTSWLSPAQAVLLVPLIALAVFPTAVSAAPPILRRGINGGSDGLYRRDSSNSQSSGSISMSVWVRCVQFLWGVVCAEWTLCSCFPCASFPSPLVITASYSHRHRGLYLLLALHLRPSVCGERCNRIDDYKSRYCFHQW